MTNKKQTQKTPQTKQSGKKRKPVKSRRRQPRKKSEFDDSVLEIRRVTRVVAGGKRFSFRATVVIGNRKGVVGIGVGKGLDVADSIRKARHTAEKNKITVNLKDDRTVPYEVESKYGAAEVRLKPAKEGHGLIAGGAARVVLDLAGVRDISAKIIGRTNNKLNNARATLKALQIFKKTS